MTNLETEEKVVAQMSFSELKEFRKWFAEFDGDVWDAQIESDAAKGKLDFLAQEAIAEYRTGKMDRR